LTLQKEIPVVICGFYTCLLFLRRIHNESKTYKKPYAACGVGDGTVPDPAVHHGSLSQQLAGR
jgi:hypothetical protein